MDILLDRVHGHDPQKGQMIAALKTGRWPHSLIFDGPSGVGKKLFASALAQVLLCQKAELACGVCGDCQRVSKGQHESLLLVEAEKSQIKVEKSDEVQEFFKLKSLSSARVVIIDEAHFLNPQAGNSLLKLLEEPPENSYFFLITSNLRHILPTLRSRSQVLRFEPLSIDVLNALSPSPLWMRRTARGSLEKLTQLQQNDSDLRVRAGQWLKSLLSGEIVFLDDEVKLVVKQKNTAQELSQYWVTYLRDAALPAESRDVLNIDQTDLLKVLSQHPKEKLLDVAHLCLKWQSTLNGPRDGLLSFEQFCKKAAELKS